MLVSLSNPCEYCLKTVYNNPYGLGPPMVFIDLLQLREKSVFLFALRFPKSIGSFV